MKKDTRKYKLIINYDLAPSKQEFIIGQSAARARMGSIGIYGFIYTNDEYEVYIPNHRIDSIKMQEIKE